MFKENVQRSNKNLMYDCISTTYSRRMAGQATRQHGDRVTVDGITGILPPHTYFAVSAIFHYLGPAFAVLLFTQVPVLGVAWLRIATAAAVFAIWRRPWRFVNGWSWAERRLLVVLGVVLGLMNASFYLAIARLPLGTVGAIEFLGPIALATLGVRSWRNVVALGLAIVGVGVLTEVRIEGEPLGFALAFANCALFTLYIMLGHGIAQDDDRVDRLGAAMLIALLTASPIGFISAIVAFDQPRLLLAGIGVGICSSVIPYVCDQLAMAQLPRATFALLLALLPACAAVIGFVVLRQRPFLSEIIGIAVIVIAVAVHREGG